MLILSASDVRQALPMGAAIAAMKRAYAALSSGRAEVPLRTRLPVAPHEAVSLFMPVFLQDEGGEALAVKVVSLFPRNAARDLPMIQAVVLVLEANTGRLLALLEGSTLTAIRRAASGAATDLLARPDSQVAAVWGGRPGSYQLEAICSVRPIQTAWVYDTDASRLEAFIQDQQAGSRSQATCARRPPSPGGCGSRCDLHRDHIHHPGVLRRRPQARRAHQWGRRLHPRDAGSARETVRRFRVIVDCVRPL
jgi:ornithine cyclodeaminase/alanine dehydrogenase-like protein (mu-crystallin family)